MELATDRIRWIFFDVGETIVDESLPIQASVEQFVRYAGELGYFIAPSTVYETFVQAYKGYQDRPMKHVMDTFIADEEDRKTIRSKMQYQKQLDRPFPDAERVLSLLAERYRLGVIANQSAGTSLRLEQYGLLQYISVVSASAEAGVAKPDAKLFQFALEKAGCEPQQAVMVGDRIDNDIVPAHRLGMGTVWVRQGLAREQPIPHMGVAPDVTVERLADIVPVFIDAE